MVKYGPTIENLNMIHDKARSKKDGIYLFRGLVYRVSKNRFTHFAHNGRIMERAGNFNVDVGGYSGYTDDAKKVLRTLSA